MKKFFILIFISSLLCSPLCVFASQKVPFTPQAPFGNWKDQRFQDGCEEASVLMAIRWVRGQSLTREEAKKEILKIADWEQKKYKNYRDTSASDTAKRLLNEYYGYKNYEVKNNITLAQIISEVKKNNLVIVPTNGQKLKNPYFTRPGPDRHMLVIIGYDNVKKQFITNDPGTKHGEGYRYNEKILFDAIRDYPTGAHLKIKNEKKAGIIVKLSLTSSK